MNKMIINNVRVIENENITHFVPVENIETDKQSDGLWRKLAIWWKNLIVKPYIKTRNLSDPFDNRIKDLDDIDAGSDGKNGYEIGLKISF